MSIVTEKKSGILRPAITLLIVFVVLTGFIFPAVIWGISQAIFPHQANGSLITDSNGKAIGSELIGQSFSDPKYFHPRPSAAGAGYDAANSSGTNLGPTSDKLINGIKDDPETKDSDETYLGINDLARLYRKDNGLKEDIRLPADSVTRSASGLDPNISVANARLQAKRVASSRGMSEADVTKLIDAQHEPRFVGLYGEARVNVLTLNLALDRLDVK